jgi:L-ribulose-5-phosphate 3-epimerase UlaE
MKRPSRLDILKYALDGVKTYYGLYSGQFSIDEEDEILDHIDWLTEEIDRVENQSKAQA